MSTAVLDARAAYRMWAPTYESETVVSRLDEQTVRSLTPPLHGLSLLDAACGTARRLHHVHARIAVGIDLVPEMLHVGREHGCSQLAAGDLRALPLGSGRFDVIWCRLAIGHVHELEECYAELARVSAPDATVIVTDFHEAAVAAGHSRTFRDSTGVLHTIEHHVYDAARHTAAAEAAGFRLTCVTDVVVDDSVRDLYEAAGRPQLYDEHAGLPLVLAIQLRR